MPEEGSEGRPPALALGDEQARKEEETHDEERAPGERPSDGDEDEERGPRWKRALRIASPLLVIAFGVAIVFLLRMTAPEPEQREEGFTGARVEVIVAERFDQRPEVHAQGHVRPAKRAQLAPHVRGRLAWVSDELTGGGYVEEGDPLLRVDATDYRLAAAAQRGQLAQAEVGLLRAESERTVAEETWALFEPGEIHSTPTGEALARSVPQLEAAREQLEASRAQLRQARENLQRTTLRAPFDALVVEETADQGQEVNPQQPVATLVGTERYHVQTSVPPAALPSLRIPPAGTEERGSEARVTQTLRGRDYVWEGWVGGLLPGVDERGGMARVVVVVPDPLGLERPEGPREVPLLIDTFVDVTLFAEPLPEDVVQLPRAALRDGDEVWLVSSEGRLDIREVDVAWRREDSVLIASGVEEGDRVVVNPIATPVDGMELRVVENVAADAEGAPVETAQR